ncbi:DUF2306 domain-containing protein [Sphingomonas nostoxanthinifaciens]|uniref:DUF2306 domain-containing protein n=1 Tax=Sphingomonas nostoxanthinifaciens TaxID=2872652 RepID=UPI001CC2080E|nr:DUF2306 domain-containing protein [Sphingomonas nostoxanthinifaciens]UAK24812.1 DUF2306 domain-containing protein [Sphingomonas nostoxanthinifaciens]
MASIADRTFAYPRRVRDPLLAGAGILLLLLAAAFGRHASQPASGMSVWMAIHLATIVPAVPLGAVMLLRPKGDRLHRRLGWLWCGLMVAGALSSFGIRARTGHLSPIHILSVLTLVTVPRAIVAARRGRIETHRRMMTILYAALVIAGYFTLLPGRMLGRWLLG